MKRRWFLSACCLNMLQASAFLVPIRIPAKVSPPVVIGSSGTIDPDTTYLEWLARQVELKTRPKPYQNVRLPMDKDLAVLLMRSSYQVADELDFIPMDGFQQQFFLFRQKEWEDYLETYPMGFVRQGELTDPNYFDFISYAQYATIASAMREGKLVFVEKINADGEKQVVRRDPVLQDNGVLPIEHSRRVGDRILEKFLETPPSFRPAVVEGAGVEAVVENWQRMMDIFRAQHFCNGASVRLLSSSGDKGRVQIQVQVESPANLWSLQMLRYRRDQLLNDFDVKALQSYLRACRLPEAAYRTEVINQGSALLHTFSWPVA